MYSGDNAEYLLQIDATGDGVVLKDGEATFVDTWTPLGLRFTMGQFKVPFGYEVLQSSADREMPERARVIRALFPGERDRGARLTGTYQWFNFMAALVNGNFTQGDPVFNSVRQQPLLRHLPARRGRPRLHRGPPVGAVRREAGDDGGERRADDRGQEHGRHDPADEITPRPRT